MLMLLVGLILLHPLIETVDFWDNFLITRQDVELEIVSLLAMFGLGFVLMFRLCMLVGSLTSSIRVPARKSAYSVGVSADPLKLELLPPLLSAPLRI